ncbi:MAG: preprotein translocase subunit YajC [Alphaproteobacteria bacterium]|nr:preprotein translocase subunit YajC [Alphaproteobacteria bacterium]
MFVSPAYAQAAGGTGGFDYMSILPLVLIFVVFYFLLIRPQQKKQKAHREMIGAVKRGDNVLTSGGLYGRVTKVIDDTRLQVEIADNVRVHVSRAMIADVLYKTEPVKETRDRKNDNDDKKNTAPEPGSGGGGKE